MYSTICVEWAVDHFGLGLTQIDPLLTKTCTKNDFCIFIASMSVTTKLFLVLELMLDPCGLGSFVE